MVKLKFVISSGAAVTIAIVCFTLWNVRSKGDVKKSITRSDRADRKYVQFDDWLNGKFRSRSFYPKWVSGSEYVNQKTDGSLVKVNLNDNTESTFLEKSAWSSLTNPSSYHVSADQQYAAITYDNTDGYAHYVKTFSVAIFETATSKPVNVPDFPSDKIQKIKWDPVGHKMAFVYNFDVYVISNFTTSPRRITTDGEENVNFNGISDWLYWLEISDDDTLLWWSPKGTYLAYATINEDDVENFAFAMFHDNLYPNMISYPYPKPGTTIPVTKTFIVDTNSKTDAKEAAPSSTVTDWGDYYLNSAMWRDDSTFMPTWKNRFGDEAVSETCAPGATWTCSHASRMKTTSTNGWLGNYKPADLVALPNKHEYMTVQSNDQKFPHLIVVNIDKDTKDWRTSGTFEVTDTAAGYKAIHFYDERNDWIYFTSTEMIDVSGEGLPRIRHLWRVHGHGIDKTRRCVTCDLNTMYKDRCNWVNPSFSTDGSYVVINCGGTGNGAPISTLHKISDDGIVGPGQVVENNDDLLKNLEEYYFRTREYGNITLPGVEGIYYYTLHYPPNFDKTKKYPMLVHVYSGPGYQETTDSWIVDWARGYIASSDLDIIVMTFDGRGTGFRGDEIRHQVFERLGEYEPIDQIEAAKQISTANSFIDESRIAIWGRSYGGYTTSRTIAEDENKIFKCGFSVAPVTDWLSYQTVYTERYMKTPNENEAGYNKSSAIQKLQNFGKHYFVLIHGTSDENVHFLNSARLSKALINEGVDFSAYFAADETHGFNRGANGYGHHYKLLTHHVKTCFGLS